MVELAVKKKSEHFESPHSFHRSGKENNNNSVFNVLINIPFNYLNCKIYLIIDLFLFVCFQGTVECWDPRVRKRVGILDCAPALLKSEDVEYVFDMKGSIYGVCLYCYKMVI